MTPSGYMSAYNADGVKTLQTWKQIMSSQVSLSQYDLTESSKQRAQRVKRYRFNQQVMSKWIKDDGVLKTDLSEQD